MLEERRKNRPHPDVDTDTQVTHVSADSLPQHSQSLDISSHQNESQTETTVALGGSPDVVMADAPDMDGHGQGGQDGPVHPASSEDEGDAACVRGSQDSILSQQALDARLSAFRAILENARNNTGQHIGLLSTTDHHTDPDRDLGEGMP